MTTLYEAIKQLYSERQQVENDYIERSRALVASRDELQERQRYYEKELADFQERMLGLGGLNQDRNRIEAVVRKTTDMHDQMIHQYAYQITKKEDEYAKLSREFQRCTASIDQQIAAIRLGGTHEKDL